MNVKRLITTALALCVGLTTFIANPQEAKAYCWDWHSQSFYELGHRPTWSVNSCSNINEELTSATGVCEGIIKDRGDGTYDGTEADAILSIRENPHSVIRTKGDTNAAIQLILSNGCLTEFIQEFKDWGFLDQNYVQPEGIKELNRGIEKQCWLEDGYRIYQKNGIKPAISKKLTARIDTTLKSDCLPTATDIMNIPTGTPMKVLGYTETCYYYVDLGNGVVGFVDPYATARPAPSEQN